MKIIERIYDELHAQNKSAADLARYLGVTTGQTTAWKQRKTDPPAKYIPDIADFLNCSIDYILKGEYEETSALALSPNKVEDTLTIIKNLLDKNNIKQKDLTDFLGLSKNIFTDWKSGKCESYNRYLPQIAAFFDVSVDYLLGREKIKKEPTSIPTSGNARVDSIIEILLSLNVDDNDLHIIEAVLDKYKK